MEDGGDGDDEEECGETQQQLHNRRTRLRDRLKLAIIATAEQTGAVVGDGVECSTEAGHGGVSPCDECFGGSYLQVCCGETFGGLTENVAIDTELFAQHAGRKSVMMDDVLLAARRNEDVVASLRLSAQNILKSKEQQKRKKATAKAVET